MESKKETRKKRETRRVETQHFGHYSTYERVSVEKLRAQADVMEQPPYGASKVLIDLSPEYLDSTHRCQSRECGCRATHLCDYDGELGEYLKGYCTRCARRNGEQNAKEFRVKHRLGLSDKELAILKNMEADTTYGARIITKEQASQKCSEASCTNLGTHYYVLIASIEYTYCEAHAKLQHEKRIAYRKQQPGL